MARAVDLSSKMVHNVAHGFVFLRSTLFTLVFAGKLRGPPPFVGSSYVDLLEPGTCKEWWLYSRPLF